MWEFGVRALKDPLTGSRDSVVRSFRACCPGLRRVRSYRHFLRESFLGERTLFVIPTQELVLLRPPV